MSPIAFDFSFSAVGNIFDRLRSFKTRYKSLAGFSICFCCISKNSICACALDMRISLQGQGNTQEGGHNIDADAVTKRFSKRFEDLLAVLPYCDEATFYDNDNGFRTVAKYKNGELQPIGSNPPLWLQEFIKKFNQLSVC